VNPSAPAGDPFGSPGPRWFTIAAHRPFLADLAATLHRTLSADGPEALADAVVLTPTRRGARALAEAFFDAAQGRAVLLPRIRALGDLDEGEPPFEPASLALDLPPAISPLNRRFELARLIVDRGGLPRAPDAAQALELADALGAFLDSLSIEECFEPDAIDTLVDGDLARHWLRSAAFLSVATRLWPARLAELGLVDPVERRVTLLRRLAEQWERTPPSGPLIAAGSTGTGPSTADLLGVIARAPQGCVVLPGLDLDLADDAWELVGEQHPQGALKRLIERHGLGREAIRPWPADEDLRAARLGRSRRRVVNEALRPADATADWLGQIDKLRAEAGPGAGDPIAEGFAGLSLVATRTEAEAASVAALLLREALETPGKTCALVTPDAALTRRVSAQLSRWGVEADSSTGASLTRFPVGVLLGLILRATVEPMRPAGLLGLLKHPLVRLGRDEPTLVRAREALEGAALRGPRPVDWDQIDRRLEAMAEMVRSRDEPSPSRLESLALAASLVADLRAALALADRFVAGETAVPEAAAGLAHAAEALAVGPEGGLGGLWSGPGGEAAAQLIAELAAEGAVLTHVTAAGFERLVQTLLAGETVRTGGASHPRLRMLGALEARLVRADVLVLAGLEEGVWPQGAPIDPFLSRPMRRTLSLPPPERRIGLSAHDFAQAACAPEVVLIHSERRGGQPAVPSRWLWRLQTLAKGAKVEIPSRADALAWARALDSPRHATPRYAPRPAPRPPVEARPRGLSVTAVERWVRDPYAIYARHVLKLRVLDRPDAPAEAAARGRAVHKALERLVLAHPRDLPEDAEALIERLLLESLEAEGILGAAMARERPLAANAARWIVGFERRRRTPDLVFHVEQSGALILPAPGGDFTLGARADRLEVEAGLAVVLDFKTGMPPSQKQIETGFAPQLTLTAAILKAGGFAAIGPATPAALSYIRITGRRIPGEEHVRAAGGDEAEVLAEAALQGLIGRIARFDDPDTPYLSWTAPQFMSAYGGDYDHLARVREWAVLADGGEGGGE
jgi:ATP-dependent helicase/nuclease subunit B